jgi:cytochrome c oxidase cbb3-type subunit 1
MIRPRNEEWQESSVVAEAAWHGLAWLFLANLLGVWLAILLLVPSAGGWLGEWTYGRWMPVHLNMQLYGWISLPLVAWLLHLYRADRSTIAIWSRTALWMWSLALALGSLSWLAGGSSGKLFLDWSGFPRIYFPLSILFLWAVLAFAFARNWGSITDNLLMRAAKLIGLSLLLPIPFALYAAANPAVYPPVNPDSGGPTAASQLESVLVVVFILFLLPYGLAKRKPDKGRWIVTAWIIFAVESLLCLALGRADVSHHRPTQFVSLGSLLVWVLLIPAYYSSFSWSKRSRMWEGAVLFWWALLIPTGWCLFLPGVLDHLKFTDGMVSHSLMAMAGFVSSLLILMMSALVEHEADVFDSRWAFALWNGATFLYVAVMLYAGWIEGNQPTFTMVPSATRNILYILRLMCGIAMTAASANWVFRMTHVIRARRLDELAAHRNIPPSSSELERV